MSQFKKAMIRKLRQRRTKFSNSFFGIDPELMTTSASYLDYQRGSGTGDRSYLSGFKPVVCE
jgi:hypothetical protein